MGFLKRIFVFLTINILVISTISLVMYVTGLDRYMYSYGVGYDGLLLTCFVWGMAGAFISLLMSRFIAKIAMRIQIIQPNTSSIDHRELLQTVYTLAQRAGIKKMPEVGIYQSNEINAFATGPTRNRALVAVSSGLVSRMNKSQIEGVLGHEIAHVANGDMVTMTLVQGIVNSFVLFASHIIVRILDQVLRDREGRGGLSGFSHYFAFQLVSGVLSFLAYPVIAFVSRYREYRADAGGARLAGFDKMVGALKALKGTEDYVDITHASVSTLKISGKKSKFMQLMSTHPDLEDRIRRLEMGRNF